jgi:pyruvate dehydrogenase E2 component (dihydrolipoamide acetyltransferase)
MAVEILMPKLGLTMKTGTVVKWFKEEGDPVQANEPVLEIETEKLSHQIESPADGVLLKRIAVVGEKYPITFVVGYIGQPGEQIPAGVAAGATASASPVREAAPELRSVISASIPGGRVFISPVARKLAAELGLDYKQIRGTGPRSMQTSGVPYPQWRRRPGRKKPTPSFLISASAGRSDQTCSRPGPQSPWSRTMSWPT